jgi:hypothetical protein
MTRSTRLLSLVTTLSTVLILGGAPPALGVSAAPAHAEAATDPAPLNLEKSGQFHTARVRLANDVKVGANATTAVQVAGVDGLPATDLASVAVNVSAKGDWFNNGSLKIYPTGTPEPNTTALSYNAAFYLPNMVTAMVGADGKINLTNKSDQPVKFYLDVHGYTLAEEQPSVTKGSTYVPLNPAVILDNQPVAAGGNYELQPLGQAGVPEEYVDAVALNVSTLSPRDSGTLRVYPAGDGFPLDATIDYVPNRKLQNSVIAKVGTDGKINVHNLSMGATNVWVEVTGYFATAGTVPEHLALNAVQPARVASDVSIAAGGEHTLALREVGGVPIDADGVGINLTTKSASGAGALQVYPAGATNPGGQIVNYQAGNQMSGFTFAKLGTDGKVIIRNAGSATTTVSVDVYSYTQLVPEVEPDDDVMGENGGTYLTNVTEATADACKDASEAADTSLGDNCVTGTELTVGPAEEGEGPMVVDGKQLAAARPWKYRSVKATSCWSSGKPVWGGGKGWKCGVAKASVAGSFKYNGKAIFVSWVDCNYSDNSLAEVDIRWCGHWNNGAGAYPGYPRYMNIGLNATVRYFRHRRLPFYIRIDGWPSGKVSLRG